MSSKTSVGCIFLASGFGKRFGGNKLLADCGGVPLIERVFAAFPFEMFLQTVVVTRYAPVAISAAQYGFTVVENDAPDDLSQTIRLGLQALRPGMGGCMFSVCDQPNLCAESIARLVRAFQSDPARITALGCDGRRGNPVIFPASLLPELDALAPHESGATVISRHPELLTIVEVTDPRELTDVDTPADLPL